MLEVLIFYFSALVAIAGAVLMIVQRNPVASVLYLILSLAAQAVLYIQLSALFIGALLIIVYAGAILVLFLFVIMLLNLRGEHFEDKGPRLGRATKYALSVLFFAEFVVIIKELAFTERAGMLAAETAADFGGVEPVAELLYTKYLYPFELTSVLLLVAVVGAVLMAKREKTARQEDI
ncbi:MAG: NADH-quinone oxidoreductase subunit J [Candidatus Zixiibacteriota bacterium]|nr:MAG: NADH-quinone oxidoreductase subunit J [candidate division Zixibacteria bacterium]